MVASAKDNHKILRLLLSDARVDPSENDNKALRIAFENRHWDIVDILLDDGRVEQSKARAPTGPSIDNNILIRSASEEENTETLNLLLDDGRIDIVTKMLAITYLAGLYLKDWTSITTKLPTLDLNRISYLSSLSLDKIRDKDKDNSKYDKTIIKSKFFWWFRLYRLCGISESMVKDPFGLGMEGGWI